MSRLVRSPLQRPAAAVSASGPPRTDLRVFRYVTKRQKIIENRGWFLMFSQQVLVNKNSIRSSAGSAAEPQVQSLLQLLFQRLVRGSDTRESPDHCTVEKYAHASVGIFFDFEARPEMLRDRVHLGDRVTDHHTPDTWILEHGVVLVRVLPVHKYGRELSVIVDETNPQPSLVDVQSEYSGHALSLCHVSGSPSDDRELSEQLSGHLPVKSAD